MKKLVLVALLLLASANAFAQPHSSIRSNLIGITPVLKCPTREVIEQIEQACHKIGGEFSFFVPLAGQGSCDTWKPYLEPVRTDPTDPDLVTYVFNGTISLGFCYQND